MYSRSKGMTHTEPYLTPPPGYDGSRFRKRSDGRDEAFLAAYTPPPAPKETARDSFEEPICCPKDEEPPDVCPESEEIQCSDDEAGAAKGPPLRHRPLQFLGEEELLLISLILILAGGNDANTDVVLLLSLLLCIS